MTDQFIFTAKKTGHSKTKTVLIKTKKGAPKEQTKQNEE